MIRSGFQIILIVLLTLIAATAQSYDRKRGSTRTSAELKLVSPTDLRQTRIGVFAPGRQLQKIQHLTDMLLIVSTSGSDIDTILRLPNGKRHKSRRSLFRARVFAVTGGKIHNDAAAWCSPWRQDVSYCQLDCDGGAFSLRRLTGGLEKNRLDLIIGTQSDWELPTNTGFSINACHYEAPLKLRIIPSKGSNLIPLAFQER